MFKVGLSHPHLQRDPSMFNWIFTNPLLIHERPDPAAQVVSDSDHWIWYLYTMGEKVETHPAPSLPVKRWKNSTSSQGKIMGSKLDVLLLTQIPSTNYNTFFALETFHMYSTGFSRFLKPPERQRT